MIIDAPFFKISFLNENFLLKKLFHVICWDSPYELLSKIWSL